jgi:hypothetical protein
MALICRSRWLDKRRIGQEIKHLDEWWGKKVSLDFLFFGTKEMKSYLTTAGFGLAEIIERDPYPEAIEYPSPRAYIFAKKE